MNEQVKKTKRELVFKINEIDNSIDMISLMKQKFFEDLKNYEHSVHGSETHKNPNQVSNQNENE